MRKYIFITGGVVSSVGKGIVSASLGTLLKSSGFQVSVLKLDPYINVDPGTMSPYQHGEVFVTDDGAETDLDLGHYERFLDIELGSMNSASSGQVYEEVIRKERRGDYLGGTIQAIPHVTSEIRKIIKAAGEKNDADFVLVEVGGTVGDMEGQPFLEAISRMRHVLDPADTLSIHVTLLPYIQSTKELKTKPTQHSVRELRAFGVQPDIIITRADSHVSEALREKIALFCNLNKDSVIPLKTADSIYEVPIILNSAGLLDVVFKTMILSTKKADLELWRNFVAKLINLKHSVDIALVGKYTELEDAYLSIKEALIHAGVYYESDINILWINSESLENDEAINIIGKVDGILLCPGFGNRGIEGKIKAAEYARINKIPYLGDCLGMQVLVCEFARNVAGMIGANTTELDPSTPFPVISLLSEQEELKNMGGTMRLGGYDCQLVANTKTFAAYGKDVIRERHRHRYEFNNTYIDALESNGLIVSGRSIEGNLVEVVELKNHPFMIGAQFHPEFTSRPSKPNPLFKSFIKAALNYKLTTKNQDVNKVESNN
ncbi:MAG: CTP synthase [Chloroflexi bacterium]|jgi:CTP synthase|nr:MAG: CTP synthase [Chloroflexota bacterium]